MKLNAKLLFLEDLKSTVSKFLSLKITLFIKTLQRKPPKQIYLFVHFVISSHECRDLKLCLKSFISLLCMSAYVSQIQFGEMLKKDTAILFSNQYFNLHVCPSFRPSVTLHHFYKFIVSDTTSDHCYS